MIHVVFRESRPYLFTSAWKTLLVPNDWLYSLRCDGTTQSPQTWRTYAYALADYLAWCERERVDWQTLGRVDMEQYLGSLTTADESINQRITILVRFYRWCEAQGITLRAPFVFRETFVRRPGFLSMTRRVMRASVLRHIPRSEKVVVPRVADIWTLRSAMPCWRDLLIVETFAFTGLRCAELLDLRIEQFSDARIAAQETALLVKVVGKGRKQRHVPFPAALVRNLQRYILLERKYVARAARTDRVFVSAKGAPLTSGGVQFRLRTASRKLNLQVHPHLLRHFFACHRLKYLSDLGLGDPLGQLQRELGHSQITTTTRYLHLTDEVRARIATEHQDFIAAIAAGKKTLTDGWPAELRPPAMNQERRAI